MGRSIKKGPFVAPKLLARVQEMNEKGEKSFSKLGAAAPQSSLTLSATHLQFMTDANMFPYMLQRTW